MLLIFEELAALDGGGEIGAVVGDDAAESFDGVVAVVGDGEDEVGVAASCGSDVEASVGGGVGDDGEAGVGGFALRSMFGGGVAEVGVFGDVVGGEGDGAFAVEAGDDEPAVRVDGVDGPAVSVADGVSGRCDESTVVAPSRDDVTGVPDADRERRDRIRFEIASLETQSAWMASLMVWTSSLRVVVIASVVPMVWCHRHSLTTPARCSSNVPAMIAPCST